MKPICIFLKNCAHEVMVSTVIAENCIPFSESVPARVSNSHGVSFAIAGFMIPNTTNRQKSYPAARASPLLPPPLIGREKKSQMSLTE